MSLTVVLFALIASAGAYGAIAYWNFTKIKTVKDLFHIDTANKTREKECDGALSLLAANLTLGTGMVYIASLAQQQAAMAFLAPLGVLLGYFLLSRVVSNISMSAAGANHNILDVIRIGLGGKAFYFIISIVLVLTYLILIPFEIYVSSSLLASLVPTSQSTRMPEVFAYSLFFIVVVYSALGGLRGVVATDKMQMGIMGLMIVVVLVGAYVYSEDSQGAKDIKLFPGGDVDTMLTLALASFVTAVSTQIYSILNLSMGTNFDSEKQIRVYRKAGIALFAALSLFAVTGMASGSMGTSSFASIDILLGKLSAANTEVGTVAVFVIVLGMMAVLISSADSGIMAISQTTYDNIFCMNSFAEEGGVKLLVARLAFIFALNAVAAVPLVIIFNRQPDVVGLLLSSIAALTVAAPFIVSSVLNISRTGACIISNVWVAGFVVLIIISAWVISISGTIRGDHSIGNYAILLGTLCGVVFYWIDSAVSEKHKHRITKASS